MKVCGTCSQNLPLYKFGRHAQAKDGLRFACKPCVLAKKKEYISRNPAIYAETERKREEKRRGNRSEERKARYAKNRESLLATERETRLLHPERFKVKGQKYRAKYPGKNREKSRRYEAYRGLAAPKWRNSFFIVEIYDLAVKRSNLSGFSWHVDHIVPLKSDLVCGLHTEMNLRVIPARENLQKSNKHWPDMP